MGSILNRLRFWFGTPANPGPPGIPLDAKARQNLIALFSNSEQPVAERLLLDWSATYQDPMIPATPEGWARVRAAALRLSRGDLEKLKRSIALGRRDWRDLLMAADFGDDVRAHERWTFRKVTPELLAGWIAGGEVPGVELRHGDAVQVYGGEHPSGIRGTVVSLVDFEPEPQYLVALATGQQIRASQSWLSKASS